MREFTGKHGEGTPIFHRKSWEVNSKLAESKIHNWLVDPQHVTTSSNLGSNWGHNITWIKIETNPKMLRINMDKLQFFTPPRF